MSRTPPAPEAKSAGRPRDPDVSKRAIAAVLTLYSDFGLSGISFEKVAREASVGKAALYSRWASVEELLVEALSTIAPPPSTVDTGSLRSDLRQLILRLSDLYAGPYGRVTVRINLDAAVRSTLRPHYDAFISSYVRAARSIVARGVASGELDKATDPSLLLEQIFGATMLHMLFFTRPDRAVLISEASEFADKLVENVLSGVLQGPTE